MTMTMEVDGEMIEMTDFVPCRAAMFEDDSMVTLQIELRDGRAVTLNVYEDGYVSVALWYGSGEHHLVTNADEHCGDSVGSFREWCELAIGKRPSPYPEVERKSDADTTPRRSIR
jgi:hypothetical protein